MFLLSTEGGKNVGTPDVCNTPAAAGAPVPTPYVNISDCATSNPSTVAQSVFASGMPSVNLSTEIPLSNGDEAGTQMGVVSGEIMGLTRFQSGSTKVFIEGSPAQRLTSSTGQNGSNMNCLGTTVAPGQTIVMILS
ncbi:DUF4150 domain-containing protein [Desulfonauticus submarinus]|uniref:Uncharacterized protein n=1 Tax=Desulfonauticus submarinus TaxID=206665 RepID=A0A1G9ZV24_9BACT|nr:DUF4150 domain-containing protein [Desulfonauticus submarinus]SDN25110.1 protein of unknown function [Desulfonauticus submarinus]